VLVCCFPFMKVDVARLDKGVGSQFPLPNIRVEFLEALKL